VNTMLSEPIIMELGMNTMAPEPISMAYFINPFHQSECLYVYINIIARQQLSKNVTMVMSTYETVEEFVIPLYL
jgi:hypothetical protein